MPAVMEKTVQSSLSPHATMLSCGKKDGRLSKKKTPRRNFCKKKKKEEEEEEEEEEPLGDTTSSELGLGASSGLTPSSPPLLLPRG